eukprot:s2049_g12.t1
MHLAARAGWIFLLESSVVGHKVMANQPPQRQALVLSCEVPGEYPLPGARYNAEKLSKFFRRANVPTRLNVGGKLTLERAKEDISDFFSTHCQVHVLYGIFHGSQGSWKLSDGTTLMLADILEQWDSAKAQGTAQHLLIVSDSCQSGRMVNEATLLGRGDIAVQASCARGNNSPDVVGETFTEYLLWNLLGHEMKTQRGQRMAEIERALLAHGPCYYCPAPSNFRGWVFINEEDGADYSSSRSLSLAPDTSDTSSLGGAHEDNMSNAHPLGPEDPSFAGNDEEVGLHEDNMSNQDAHPLGPEDPALAGNDEEVGLHEGNMSNEEANPLGHEDAPLAESNAGSDGVGLENAPDRTHEELFGCLFFGLNMCLILFFSGGGRDKNVPNIRHDAVGVMAVLFVDMYFCVMIWWLGRSVCSDLARICCRFRPSLFQFASDQADQNVPSFAGSRSNIGSDALLQAPLLTSRDEYSEYSAGFRLGQLDGDAFCAFLTSVILTWIEMLAFQTGAPDAASGPYCQPVLGLCIITLMCVTFWSIGWASLSSGRILARICWQHFPTDEHGLMFGIEQGVVGHFCGFLILVAPLSFTVWLGQSQDNPHRPIGVLQVVLAVSVVSYSCWSASRLFLFLGAVLASFCRKICPNRSQD